MNRATAEVIRTAAAEALADAVAAGTVAVALDQERALAAVAAGMDSVFIAPPRTTFETGFHAAAEWTAYLVAGSSDRDESWRRVDDLLAALREPLDVDEARPYDWQPDDGAPLVAYEITFTTNHDL